MVSVLTTIMVFSLITSLLATRTVEPCTRVTISLSKIQYFFWGSHVNLDTIERLLSSGLHVVSNRVHRVSCVPCAAQLKETRHESSHASQESHGHERADHCQRDEPFDDCSNLKSSRRRPTDGRPFFATASWLDKSADATSYEPLTD